MLAAGGSRLWHRLQECDFPSLLGLNLGLRLRCHYNAQIVQFSLHSPLKPCWGGIAFADKHYTMSSSLSSSYSSIPSKFHGELPLPSDSFSQREDDGDIMSEGLSPVAGGIVALGKFDALHIGHRELAIQASRAGAPFLLSFAGMAEVLGWEHRVPIVAKCDRERVLSSWAPYCCNMVPKEFQLEFSSVRHLTPRQFVEKLSKELAVHGVVAGENYRFGYKAAGDALQLVKLCEEYGMESYIISFVMDKNQYSENVSSSNLKERGQVSSTRVRHALAEGDMRYVSELLGRHHRLILMATDQGRITFDPYKVSAPKSCLLNQAPKEGLYENCSLFLGQENCVQCRVVIDTKFVYVETEDVGLSELLGTPYPQFLQIEFGSSSA